MVFSVKANKKRIIAVLAVIAIVICGIIILPKMVTAPIKHYGETPSQRAEFLKSYGWVISAEPIDSRDVTIPQNFNEVYAKYNVMQKAQGFDLKPYAGLNCTQYIYLVENYPNIDREIHATLLVYEGVIVGGDICCAEVDGFMHGFALDSARYGEDASKSAEQSKAPAKSAAPKDAAPKDGDAKKTDAALEGEIPDAETGAEVTEEGTDVETGAEFTEDGGEAPAEDVNAENQGEEEPVDAPVNEEDYPTD